MVAFAAAMRTPDLRPNHEAKSKKDLVKILLNITFRLLQEQWFSSLQTLQEAFLRPELLFPKHKNLPPAMPDLDGAFLWMKHIMSDAQISGVKEGDLIYKQ